MSALALLLSYTGPAVLMGHSIGDALAIKPTEIGHCLSSSCRRR